MSYVTATHAPDCHPCAGHPHSCAGTYVCPRCEGEFGWCTGASDDTPALCDECANVVQTDEPSAVATV